LFFSTSAANNVVLLFATIQSEFSATNEEVKLDVELHDIIMACIPCMKHFNVVTLQFKVSELCQWQQTAK